MITASCGHEINLEWHENPKSFIIYKDWDEGNPVSVSAIVCKKCRTYYLRKKLILKNKHEEEIWIKHK